VVAFVYPLLFAAIFLGIPIVIAAKASSGRTGSRVGTFFLFLGAYSGGVITAAVITFAVAAMLPRPSGPPDQAAGQIMALTFVVFPLASLFLGAVGMCVVACYRR
jgi:hypothetical protein